MKYKETNLVLKTFDNSNIEENIETLIINIESFEFETKKNEFMFSTFFMFFEKFDQIDVMVLKLINRAFSHCLKNENLVQITSAFQKSTNLIDSIVYLNIDRYTFSEFFGVMIDTNIFTYSIVDYEQYLTYSKIHNIIFIINVIKTKLFTCNLI